MSVVDVNVVIAGLVVTTLGCLAMQGWRVDASMGIVAIGVAGGGIAGIVAWAMLRVFGAVVIDIPVICAG
jgi:hypothetical protein